MILKKKNLTIKEKIIPLKAGQKKGIKKAFLFFLILPAAGLYLAVQYNLLPVNLNNQKKSGIIKPIADSSFEERIIIEFAKLNLEVKNLSNLEGGNVEVLTNNGLTILISKLKDLDYQLTSLQLILSRFRIEGRKIKKIDLRFVNPIVE